MFCWPNEFNFIEAINFLASLNSVFFSFYPERNLEDHENLMSILKTWAPGSNNKLLFRKDLRKYHFFAHTTVS